MASSHVDRQKNGPEIPSEVWTYQQAYGSGDRPKGTYCSNNGVLAIVDGEGSMRFAPMTSERARSLNEAGFTSDSWYVPNSNGDMPKEMADWFDATRRLDDEKRAEKTPVPRIPGAELMTDGAKRITTYRVLTYSVLDKDGKAILGSPRPEDEPRTVCYVTLNQNPNGSSKYEYDLYSAPYTPDAVKQLEAAGFTRDAWHPGVVSVVEGTRTWTARILG